MFERTGASSPLEPQPDEPSGFAAKTIRDLLGASALLDPIAFRSGLDNACEILGLVGCVDQVLMPTVERAGLREHSGKLARGRELMLSEAARSWIASRSAYAPTPSRQGPIMLACGPRDQHTVGTEALGMLLRFEGWPCRVLGARVPVVALTTATQATAAVAVIVSSQLPRGRSSAIASIEAVDRLGVKVFWGGLSFAHAESRGGVPGTYLGIRMGAARTLIASALELA